MASEAQGKFSIDNGMRPMGDQPAAIRTLADGLRQGLKHQTLLGVTGSGKTFTMAGIVEQVQRPALVIAHNKTLAAQLATEFREIFPNNAVEYFVSYYDYYQPESYIPRTDTYIDKEADINDEIQRLRLSATKSLMTRRDVLIVASVSCIYGLGSPEQYRRTMLELKKGMETGLLKTTRRLTAMHYERSNLDVASGKFRVKGDTLEIIPSEEETIIRVQFWGDEVEELTEIDPITGEVLDRMDAVTIFPAKHFVLPQEDVDAGLTDIELELEQRLAELNSANKLLEAQRLEQRTRYDLELLREVGTCLGVENYSRHLGRRAPGSAPWTLLDYFPDDYLVLIDESHITLPQIRAMQKGDYSRKSTLVEYGFRLPSAIDNRPLKFEEFEDRVGQIVYVSATPGPYEKENQQLRAEQIIRPTGLVDPSVIVKPTDGQIDDLLANIRERIARHERVLVTTLTKRMAEQLSEHLAEMEIKVHHLHSEVHTLERTEILRNLRLGIYDVVVGINLLREGLDLPEVSLVAILDADKEGYLRSETSLIQTIGRAARHLNGTVIMYADRVTDSMRHAIDETDRRRQIQSEYNAREGIEPRSIVKEVKDITDRVRELAGAEAGDGDMVGEERVEYNLAKLGKSGSARLIRDLEKQMRQAAKDLKFEKAAMLRDQIKEVRGVLAAMRETVGI